LPSSSSLNVQLQKNVFFHYIVVSPSSDLREGRGGTQGTLIISRIFGITDNSKVSTSVGWFSDFLKTCWVRVLEKFTRLALVLCF
jgi:hypothetical protein